MVDNTMLSNISKVSDLITELRELPVGVIKDICKRVGIDYSSDDKEELIITIMETELSKKELEDYQKYVKYYYYAMFKKQASGFAKIDGYITEIEDLYRIKSEAAREKSSASERRRVVELELMNEISINRLNIEYSHVERSYDHYISEMTKTGMKLASMIDDQEEIKKRGLIYNFLKKGTLGELSRKEETYRVQRNAILDELHASYLDSAKKYGEFLKKAFFSALDNRDISEAVYLNSTLSMDFESEDAYKLGHAKNHRLTLEEKEEIFKDFLNDANFEPEDSLTGKNFYEAVRKFVTKYYSTMESRLSVRQSRCISKIRDVVSKQKDVVKEMMNDEAEPGIIIRDEASLLSLICRYKRGT